MQEHFVRDIEREGERENSVAACSLSKPLVWVIIFSGLSLNVILLFMWNTSVQKTYEIEARFQAQNFEIEARYLDQLSKSETRFQDQLNMREARFQDQLNESEARFQDQLNESEARF